MSVNYINKDIITVTTGIVAHGVNCQGRMASGVAKAIRKKWPEVYDSYMSLPTGKAMLGTCHIVNVGEQDELFVANCYTQMFYGYGGGRYADPKALELALHGAFQWADFYHLPLYLPKIGAGLGGLDWETEVKPIIEDVASKWHRVDTYVCSWP